MIAFALVSGTFCSNEMQSLGQTDPGALTALPIKQSNSADRCHQPRLRVARDLGRKRLEVRLVIGADPYLDQLVIAEVTSDFLAQLHRIALFTNLSKRGEMVGQTFEIASLLCIQFHEACV